MNKIIINIGRQFGSGGKDVADKIGEKLGIPVYDNELLSKAAQDFGFTEELFKSRDEKRGVSLSLRYSPQAFLAAAPTSRMTAPYSACRHIQYGTLRRRARQ